MNFWAIKFLIFMYKYFYLGEWMENGCSVATILTNLDKYN